MDKLYIVIPAYNEEANIQKPFSNGIPLLKNIAAAEPQKWLLSTTEALTTPGRFCAGFQNPCPF